jgi:hypothetical protein
VVGGSVVVESTGMLVEVVELTETEVVDVVVVDVVVVAPGATVMP